MVPGNIVGCCETIDIRERRDGVWRLRISTPPIEMVGVSYLDSGVS
jgi:hypothetical protein